MGACRARLHQHHSGGMSDWKLHRVRYISLHLLHSRAQGALSAQRPGPALLRLVVPLHDLHLVRSLHIPSANRAHVTASPLPLLRTDRHDPRAHPHHRLWPHVPLRVRQGRLRLLLLQGALWASGGVFSNFYRNRSFCPGRRPHHPARREQHAQPGGLRARVRPSDDARDALHGGLRDDGLLAIRRTHQVCHLTQHRRHARSSRQEPPVPGYLPQLPSSVPPRLPDLRHDRRQ
mmetsp:Transcript_29316/g.57382  ORF Transcript_29316/g.57382 Transcript_29316/m.57382 type:complete len:233 (-) Transcript_29316:541-1239(-)